jgi:hypothetical protein
MRGVHGEAERDRTPPAAEVEEVPARRWRWSVRQQHRGAGVHVVGAEDASGRRDLQVASGEPDADTAQILGAGGRRTEVVVAPHG